MALALSLKMGVGGPQGSSSEVSLSPVVSEGIMGHSTKTWVRLWLSFAYMACVKTCVSPR